MSNLIQNVQIEKSNLDKLKEKQKLIEKDPTFIQSIRFPNYKNFAQNSIINFSFYITAIVGENGTNKTSVLKAMFGAPRGYSLGTLWFSTPIDNIPEKNNNPQRYIYSYYVNDFGQVEVRMVKAKRIGEPDYWESSRPSLSDDMDEIPQEITKQTTKYRNQTRWNPINKNVIYIDCKSEVSAFDKIMSRTAFSALFKANQDDKKKFIRRRSVPLQKVLNSQQQIYPWGKVKNRVHSNFELDAEYVAIINKVLNKSYKKIKLVEHTFFETSSSGYTVKIESDNLMYSEAFAGSGEFMIIMLIYRIVKAEKNSLILIDEPEISLHPRAQHELMDFLFGECLRNNHQMVLSTHSPNIIRNLPEQAIKLFIKSDKSISILQNISEKDAFFYIGQEFEKKIIYVEDELAKYCIIKSLKESPSLLNQITIIPLPGGAESILTTSIYHASQSLSNNQLFILDGDKQTGDPLLSSDEIPVSKYGEYVKNQFNLSKIHSNGHKGESNSAHKNEQYKKYIDYTNKYLKFFPFQTPERFIAEHIDPSLTNIFETCNMKMHFVSLAQKSYGFKNVTSQQILNLQQIELNKIPDNHESFQFIKQIIIEFLAI